MSDKNRDDLLLEEILKNARADRKRIEDRLTELANLENVEPEVKVAIGRVTVSSVEVLTKVNSQLVEIMKVKVRERLVRQPGETLSPEEAADVFDEIDDGKN